VTNSTDRRRSRTVPAGNKPAATMVVAHRRPGNARQACPARPRCRPVPASRRTCPTAAARVGPRPVSSPGLRRSPPARDLPGPLPHQRPHGQPGPGPPGSPTRLDPGPPHQAGLPAQQKPAGHEQPHISAAGCRAAARPAPPGPPTIAPGPGLALTHRGPVTHDQDPGILGTVRPGGHGNPAGHPQHRPAAPSQRHQYRQCPAVRRRAAR